MNRVYNVSEQNNLLEKYENIKNICRQMTNEDPLKRPDCQKAFDKIHLWCIRVYDIFTTDTNFKKALQSTENQNNYNYALLREFYFNHQKFDKFISDVDIERKAMNFEQFRLESFKNVPSNLTNMVSKVAANGFYCINGKFSGNSGMFVIQCNFCFIRQLSASVEFTEDNGIAQPHELCPLILAKMTENVPIGTVLTPEDEELRNICVKGLYMHLGSIISLND